MKKEEKLISISSCRFDRLLKLQTKSMRRIPQLPFFQSHLPPASTDTLIIQIGTTKKMAQPELAHPGAPRNATCSNWIVTASTSALRDHSVNVKHRVRIPGGRYFFVQSRWVHVPVVQVDGESHVMLHVRILAAIHPPCSAFERRFRANLGTRIAKSGSTPPNIQTKYNQQTDMRMHLP